MLSTLNTMQELEQYYDPLMHENDDTGLIHHESMELTLQDAVEMVDAISGMDDGSMHDENKRTPREADPLAQARRKTNKRAREASAERKKKEPAAHAEILQRRAKRARETRAETRKDSSAHAEVKRKDRERKRVAMDEMKKDPIVYAEYRQRRNIAQGKSKVKRMAKAKQVKL